MFAIVRDKRMNLAKVMLEFYRYGGHLCMGKLVEHPIEKTWRLRLVWKAHRCEQGCYHEFRYHPIEYFAGCIWGRIKWMFTMPVGIK